MTKLYALKNGLLGSRSSKKNDANY